MRSWKTALALALIAVPLGTGVAQAQYHNGYHDNYSYRDDSYRADSHEWTQQFDRRLNRVAMGLDDAARRGDLSPREIRGLTQQRERLLAYERRAVSDGFVTPDERNYMQAELRNLYRNLRLEVADANW